MKYLQYHWKSRTFVVLAISIVVSILLISLELTDWAAQINQQGYSHGSEGKGIPSALRYILPFVKELVLIGVPLLLSLLLMKVLRWLRRAKKA
ncbi:hypothetical protein Q4602_13505 [Paraglaciecola chathamensis]|uniref:hypothetical protein n=1 Tax=Paraglaciecola chathamensis TaxID=368405 RepID=UPI0026FC7119|nr:hypothetical protein [Paraglaciecola chathamensis]MDO6840497.1 hypothetical protein [Paraglaciecola chathamensis]